MACFGGICSGCETEQKGALGDVSELGNHGTLEQGASQHHHEESEPMSGCLPKIVQREV